MQIFAKILYKFPTFLTTLAVEPSTTIKGIKEMLIDKGLFELPIQHYALHFGSKSLDEDYKTITDYGIKNEHTIEITLKKLISDIKIKFNNDIIFMSFPCFCCYSILDYKKEICKKRGYPIECQFLYSDENRTNLLEDNDFNSAPVLLIVDEKDLLTKGYRVEFNDGVKSYDIISGTELEYIEDIKEKIQTSKNLPKGSFELVFDNKALSGVYKLSDYNIYYESIINIVVEKKYLGLLVPIGEDYFFVKYKGISYSLGLSNDTTILSTKEELSDMLFQNNIDIDKMKLIFEGIILEDDINLKNGKLYGKTLELIVVE